MNLKQTIDDSTVYTTRFKVVNGQLDKFGNIKITELLKVIDDIVGEHSDILEAGHKSNLDKKLFWVISRYFVQINKLPELGDQLQLKTAICKVSGYQSVRGIQIVKDDLILISVSTQWLLLDLEKKRPQRITDHYPDRPIENILCDEQLDFPRIRQLDQGKKIMERQAYYSDLDSNNHLNNNRYLQWAFDCLPIEKIGTSTINIIQTEFLAEIRINEIVELYIYTISDKKFLIYGKHQDIHKFSILLEFDQ